MKILTNKSLKHFLILMLLVAPFALFAQPPVAAARVVASEDAVLTVTDPETMTTYTADAMPSEIDRGSVIIAWTPGTNYAFADARAVTTLTAGGGMYRFVLECVMSSNGNMISGLWTVYKNGVAVSPMRLPGTATGLGGGVGSELTITVTENGTGCPPSGMDWVLTATITCAYTGVLATVGIEGNLMCDGEPAIGAQVRARLSGGSVLTTTTMAPDGLYEFPTITNLANLNRIVINTGRILCNNLTLSGFIRFNSAPIVGAEVNFYCVTPTSVTLITPPSPVLTDENGFWSGDLMDIGGCRIRVEIIPAAE